MRQSGFVSYGAGFAPLAVAHRGGAGLATENTIEAFARSYALGIRYLETDVRLTADGVPVAFHDAGLARVTGRHGQLRRTRYAELDPLIPTLESVLRAFPDACFTVDIKDDAAVAPLVEVLHRSGAANRVCVAGAWDGVLAAVAEQAPGTRTALGWRALTRLVAAGRSGILRPRAGVPSFAHVPLNLGRLPIFGDSLLARAHDAGLRVLVWTVDEPSTMHRLLDSGVDGIFTDRPDLLREVLLARAQWVAPLPIDAEVAKLARDFERQA
jgi:glycerophosphoryl diester phosphodiesterase